MEFPIKVNYKHTNNMYEAQQWLNNLPELFAADFETASRYTKQQKEVIKYRLDTFNLTDEKRRTYLQQLTSDGLSHPTLTLVTHLSIGWSDRDAFVIICDTPQLRHLIFNFLTTTDKTQVWHNSIFDFKHIFFNTKKIPKQFIDTQLLAKTILNDADSFKSRTGLKELMSYAYGDWAVSKDDFTLEEMYEESMIKYAATDSCATYRLYRDILEDLGRWVI